MGFQLKHGKTLHVSYYNVPDTAQSSVLGRAKQKSATTEPMKGKSVILKEFLKEKKKKPRTFMFPIYNHHPPTTTILL